MKIKATRRVLCLIAMLVTLSFSTASADTLYYSDCTNCLGGVTGTFQLDKYYYNKNEIVHPYLRIDSVVTVCENGARINQESNSNLDSQNSYATYDINDKTYSQIITPAKYQPVPATYNDSGKLISPTTTILISPEIIDWSLHSSKNQTISASEYNSQPEGTYVNGNTKLIRSLTNTTVTQNLSVSLQDISNVSQSNTKFSIQSNYSAFIIPSWAPTETISTYNLGFTISKPEYYHQNSVSVNISLNRDYYIINTHPSIFVK